MAEGLRQSGFEVEHASDGTEGLDKIKALAPDLVVVDALMQGIDGFAVIAELRNIPATQHIPILMVTALDDTASIEHAFDVGATDFLTKPIHPTLLGYRVKYMMKSGQIKQELLLAKRDAEQAFRTIETLSRALEEQVEDRTAQLAATRNELAETERQLHHAQKMEALGQLAGGVAHEFNNQLTVIGGFGRAALAKVEDHDRVRECLDEIVAAADRSSGLTSQMLTFSRSHVTTNSVVSVGQVVAGVRKVLESTLGATYEIYLEIDEEANTAARIDAGVLTQALLNLSVNARDAMPGGGTLRITVARVELTGDEHLSHQSSAIVPGPYVRMSVSDTGTGIDPVIFDRIFDPFFTTKDVGRGTGLGLSVVFGIVKQGGGMIDVMTARGRGTTFSIYLPAVEGAEESESPADDAEPSLGDGETVLVAEDERAVLELVKSILSGAGYRVLTARNGVEAIEILETQADEVDLLVTDMVMPKMGGMDLANEFLRMCPNKTVVYMTGYSLELNAMREQLDDDCFFVSKPFNPNDLTETVCRALDSSENADVN